MGQVVGRMMLGLLVGVLMLMIGAQGIAAVLPYEGEVVSFFQDSFVTFAARTVDVARGMVLPWGEPFEAQWVFSSPDKRYIITTSETTSIINLHDGTTRLLTYSGMVPTWSPDGGRLLLQGLFATTNYFYLANADGTDLVRFMSEDNGVSSTLTFAPDSRHIAYSSTGNLYMTDLDNHETIRLTNTADIQEWYPQWSPNGEHLFFYWQDAAEIINLGVIDVNGQNLHYLTPNWENNVTSPDWSADSRRLCFVTEDENGAQIFVADISTAAVQRVADSYPRFGVTRVEWGAADDTLLVHWWEGNGQANLRFFADHLDADSGELLLHEQLAGRSIFDYSPYDPTVAVYREQLRICIGRLDADPMRCLEGMGAPQVMIWLP